MLTYSAAVTLYLAYVGSWVVSPVSLGEEPADIAVLARVYAYVLLA